MIYVEVLKPKVVMCLGSNRIGSAELPGMELVSKASSLLRPWEVTVKSGPSLDTNRGCLYPGSPSLFTVENVFLLFIGCPICGNLFQQSIVTLKIRQLSEKATSQEQVNKADSGHRQTIMIVQAGELCRLM